MLTQIDPRLKLLLPLVAIVLVFTVRSLPSHLLLFAVALFLLGRLGSLDPFRQRLFWLRWFLLLVVLLHTLLSPGYTLFGLSWLSSDGLVRGLTVALQVVVAMAFSLVLSRLATPSQIASAAFCVLAPLRYLGLSVRYFVEQVLLALHFVPILREEGTAALGAASVGDENTSSRNLGARIALLQNMVPPLIDNLVLRSDRIAQRSARGEDLLPQIESLPSLWPLAMADQIALIFTVVVGFLVWGLM